jgi:signal transduction histidine kinase
MATVLNRVSNFLIPNLADWFVLALTQADGHLRAVAIEHHDANRRAVLAQLSSTSTFDEPADCAMAHARNGTLAWLPRIGRSQICAWTATDFRAIRTGSIICAPISHAGGSFGALLLARETQEAYDRAMVEVADEIGRRIGTLIANAYRFEAIQEELHHVDDSLAILAHELRTPIAALRGFAQLLLRQMDRSSTVDRADVQLAVQRIDQQALRLAAMVDRMMDLARLDTGKLNLTRAEIDLRELLFNVVDLAHAGSPNRLVSVDAIRSVRADVDALRMEQVLSNLIDNAFKFSPASAPVELSLRVLRPGRAEFTVRDHGTGVPVDRREQIFDRFVQAHRDHAPVGLGLGLYISMKIVEQHGGHLRAEYPSDGGARFVVELPVLEATPTQCAPSTPDEHGGLVHDAPGAAPAWSTGSSAARRTSDVRAPRIHRPTGVPGAVATRTPA